MKKLCAFLLAGCMLFSLAACGGGAFAAANPTYRLRFGHAITDMDTFHLYMEEWAKAVFEATNGDLLVEIFPNSQLGNEEDVIEQIRQGAPIGWQTDFARLGNYVTGLSVVNAPFFVSSLEEAFSLRDSATIQGLNEELAEQFGILNFSFAWVQGDRHVFANTIAKNPAEMSSLMIRTAPAPIWVESVNSLGCRAVSLPYGEIYTGIQTRVVDGCELPYNAAFNSKLHEVSRYVMETGHIFQLNSMILSRDWFNSLPEEYQNILIEECNKAGIAASHALAEQTANSRAEMVAGGITVIPQSELDMAAFIEKSAEAYEKLGLTDVRASVYADIGK